MPVKATNERGDLLIDRGEVDAAPVMPEELKAALDAKMKALDLLLSAKGQAKYKIEIVFAKARSSWKPTAGMMSFWESGAKLNGGGDAKIYMCPGMWKDPRTGTITGKGPCGVFIPDAAHGYGHLICSKCGQGWREDQVVGEIVAKLTMQNWAPLMVKYYMKLECTVDLALKFSADDIRTQAAQEQMRQRGGELLAKVREKRVRAVSVYPLANIIRDTAGGRDLATQFYKFLRA